jgi:hypothetical protein
MADVRMFISPGHPLRPGDRLLTKAEAEVVVNEAFEKVKKAPSYEGQFQQMLKRGFVLLSCQCPTYHELPIPSEEAAGLLGPTGRPIA